MTLPDELTGTWISDPADRDAIEQFGSVTMDVDSDGSLTYTIHESTDQKIFMSCRVEDGMLISTQPSAPRE